MAKRITKESSPALAAVSAGVLNEREDFKAKKALGKKVLISGASVAGPALAFWLEKYGFDVTLVERAPELRRGGQAVDFKGSTHLTVLERMGILDAVRQAKAPDRGNGVVVNSGGCTIATVPSEFSAGEIEIARGDLSQILFELTGRTCEYIFGDSVTALAEKIDGVAVTFENSAPRVFDLVVGADGIHSNVRKLAFGPESEFVSYLGYYYALANIASETRGQGIMYSEPGRTAITGGLKAPAFFVFSSEPLEYKRDDIEQQKQLVADAYLGSGWRVPDLMKQLETAGDFYMDSVSRVNAAHYSRGRVVLLGDAAYGNTLGGFGTGLAVVGAYVLAGELLRAQGNFRDAYENYENKFRDYAKVSQKVNAGLLLAPSTRLGLYVRNKLFSVAFLFKGVMRLMDKFATDIHLEDYSTGADEATTNIS